jgi:tetratricopeptide (TPR) repeat protein
VNASLEDLRLFPGSAAAFTNLVGLYTTLNRPEDAKAMYVQALAHKVNNALLHGNRYGVAFYEGDVVEMERQVNGQKDQPGEDVPLSFASDTDAFYGHLASAREKSQRAVESARKGDAKETAAEWQMNSALREAEFGNTARARHETDAALATAATKDVQTLAALALARTGDAMQARKLADDLAHRYPLNTIINHNQSLLAADYRRLDRDRPQSPGESLGTTTTRDTVRVGNACSPVRGRRFALSRIHPRGGIFVVASGCGSGFGVPEIPRPPWPCTEFPFRCFGTAATRPCLRAGRRQNQGAPCLPGVSRALERRRP